MQDVEIDHRLTLHNVVWPRAHIAESAQHNIKHAGLAVRRVRRRRSTLDADGQTQFLALVLDVYRSVVVERVVGRDALAAHVENGRVAGHLVPDASVGAQVKRAIRSWVVAGPFQ